MYVCVKSHHLNVDTTNESEGMVKAIMQTSCMYWTDPVRFCKCAGMTLCGALPVALLVKSPAVLALVSQASVSFVFLFAVVVTVMSLSPTQSNSKFFPPCKMQS